MELVTPHIPPQPAAPPSRLNNARVLKVELGARSYPIRIGKGLAANEAAFPEAQGRALRVITDSNVAPVYLAPLLAALHIGDDRRKPGTRPGRCSTGCWRRGCRATVA